MATEQEHLETYIRRLGLDGVIPAGVRPLAGLRRYAAGEYLGEAGQPVDSLLILAEGRCRIMSLSDMGRQAILGYMRPPDVSGDIELLNGTPLLHSVCAELPTTAIAIPRQVFFDKMMGHLPFVQMLCRMFAGKLNDTSARHSSEMLYPLKNRLALHLLAEAADKGSTVLHMETTAQYLGTSARHLRRVLAEWEGEGLVSRQGSRVMILNRPGLEGLAAY